MLYLCLRRGIDVLKLLLKTLKSSDWAVALDFLSPAFFDVVPTWAITRLVATMSRNLVNRSLVEQTRAQWQKILGSSDLIVPPLPPAARIEPSLAEDKVDHGQRLLVTYFKIIHHSESCYLDLRSQSFALTAAGWQWRPSAWLHTWDPVFRRAMAAIYQGYYGQQPQLFEQGLQMLKLEHASELFKEQFGDGGGDAILFDLNRFKDSFHKIFLSCREHGTQLHPDFFALGMLLFGLYEHAAALAVPLSPGRAYHQAV